MQTRINLSIAADTLARLIAQGHLCAADFGCLDAGSKHQVWQMCLNHCRQLGACDLCGACEHDPAHRRHDTLSDKGQGAHHHASRIA
ncbi:hypothetical protein LZP73_14265 [Shewanella sp. AS16]|uniref:hypothetical protein n=1 Tax=Shewanella sp. AS16 TaxID=2907625 RepID=UPI001F1D5C38|nr:hypothetical protein [Shewanella sp. AS16]MCE9687354.1 hypothetical protein [Shewanella sp. AS16]